MTPNTVDAGSLEECIEALRTFSTEREGLSFSYSFPSSGDREIVLRLDTSDKARNKDIFDFLYSRKRKIKSDLSSEIIWERLDGSDASEIKYNIGKGPYSMFGPKDKEILDAMMRFSKALKPRIKELTE